MSPSKLVSEVKNDLDVSQNQRDARVERLWTQLNPSNHGELDFKALQKGFRKIDHPMKNADDLLKKILREVDTNGDGKIQYEEFRIFVQRADRQLFELFHNIDRDGNGKLDKNELQAAFRSAGMTVSNNRLSEFFNDMDINNDGYISFTEWRDFLLFMPGRGHESQLKAVLSFYDSVVNVTPEGDSIVSEDTLEGLGTAGSSRSLVQSLFGSLLQVAFPFGYSTTPKSAPPQTSTDPPVTAPDPDAEPHHRSALGVSGAAAGVGATPPALATGAAAAAAATTTRSTKHEQKSQEKKKLAVAAAEASREQDQGAVADVVAQDADETSARDAHQRSSTVTDDATTKKKFRLTDFIPDPGYFLAGGIAGGVSRTATAPLDRLKVFLLVKTNNQTAEVAADAAKQGRIVSAAKHAARPFKDAVREIYRAGGVWGFFAGNGLNVIKIMPETAIKFGSYEAAKRAFANFEGHGDVTQISSYSKFTAGGVAGMIAQFCVYPLDTLKFRLQCETVQGGPTGSALLRQTAVKMYADGGLRACYRGVTMGLIGMFPYSAIDMGMFELLKKSYRKSYAKYMCVHEDDANPGNLATGVIGASSGAFGASVVYPLNVVRTRLQTQGTVLHSATYTGIWDVTRKTIQGEGWRGLYKGLTPNLLKVAPALSITWVMYENSKRILGLS